MADSEFSPVSPGEILKEEFLAAYKLTQADLARATAQSLEGTRSTVLGNWGIGELGNWPIQSVILGLVQRTNTGTNSRFSARIGPGDKPYQVHTQGDRIWRISDTFRHGRA